MNSNLFGIDVSKKVFNDIDDIENEPVHNEHEIDAVDKTEAIDFVPLPDEHKTLRKYKSHLKPNISKNKNEVHIKPIADKPAYDDEFSK